jgi:drug/metabolite transporter (DMT)-like permease
MIEPSRGGRRGLATLIGALGVVLWATETGLVTFTRGLPPFEVVALSFGAASLLSPPAWLAFGASPLVALRQPLRVWLFTVLSLVAYHACVYYALQRAAPTPAALLQGCTPLLIVAGSLFLPGERLRWWHVAGTLAGFAGVVVLATDGSTSFDVLDRLDVYLVLVGVAAGLWGVYSLLTRNLPHVPTSAMGAFYAAAAVVAGAAHFAFERWVTPGPAEWAAIFALGVFPMGLALYAWDHGMKRGDLQALGAFSYVEPFIAAAFVVAAGRGELHWSLASAGALVVGGAALASRSSWDWRAIMALADRWMGRRKASRQASFAMCGNGEETPERQSEAEAQSELAVLTQAVAQASRDLSTSRRQLEALDGMARQLPGMCRTLLDRLQRLEEEAEGGRDAGRLMLHVAATAEVAEGLAAAYSQQGAALKGNVSGLAELAQRLGYGSRRPAA